MLFFEQDAMRLPWSSRPTYPGDVSTLSEDYLAWFEELLPEYPWDASLVLKCISLLQPESSYYRDWSVIMDATDRSLGETASVDARFFARMSLLGSLCEMALVRRWSNLELTRDGLGDEANHIIVDTESERLVEIIQRILEQHSKVKDITETRPYKYLQLLVIDHELLRQNRVADSRKILNQAMPRLNTIEKYAMAPEVQDHQLYIEILYHHYILTAKKDMRKVMLNKIAKFASRFGRTREIANLQRCIIRDRDLSRTQFHPTHARLIYIEEPPPPAEQARIEFRPQDHQPLYMPPAYPFYHNSTRDMPSHLPPPTTTQNYVDNYYNSSGPYQSLAPTTYNPFSGTYENPSLRSMSAAPPMHAPPLIGDEHRHPGGYNFRGGVLPSAQPTMSQTPYHYTDPWSGPRGGVMPKAQPTMNQTSYHHWSGRRTPSPPSRPPHNDSWHVAGAQENSDAISSPVRPMSKSPPGSPLTPIQERRESSD
ncbi:hypothetical protein E4T38_05278 [Aureobasidium subglaciale]|nr:hypothetical protein E4T38_05278 [Aureobasidium subglaciale]KAI5213348.1 hypothetical protein E4T40_09804 [Aureobasidium subglaciale]KAI5215725.1 hypothetical protein E4T41_09497 [Aureobasidium subglaciale]KAI5253848.1 hypothetical protein E4T46_09437 [Aureobasidium subglaciale]